MFVQGASPTDKVNELKLTLELKGGVKAIRPPVSVTVTCVELTLDICQGRVTGAAEPVAFGQAEKISVGRVVQQQNATNPRQRARLIVRAVKPQDFAGTLTLAPNTPSGCVFTLRLPAPRPTAVATSSERSGALIPVSSPGR